MAENLKFNLTHLTGARFVASFWIVCGHFVPRSVHSTALNNVVNRGNVAVCFFITMSGFITHWAYGDRALGLDKIPQYYTRRLGRVFLTAWLAMAFSAAVDVAKDQSLGSAMHLGLCVLFLEPWRDPEDWCPDGQSWTIAALLPSWLLYPWSRNLITWAARGGGKGSSQDGGRQGIGWVRGSGGAVLRLMGLIFFLWALEFGTILWLFHSSGDYLDIHQHFRTYVWPPAQFVDFFVGCASAELAKELAAMASSKSARPATGWFGRAADLAFAAVVLVVFGVPGDLEHYRIGYEPLFNHGLVPLFALFLCASAVDLSVASAAAAAASGAAAAAASGAGGAASHGGVNTAVVLGAERANGAEAMKGGVGASLVARALMHPIPLALGGCSFQVFLFQWPMHELVTSVCGRHSEKSAVVFAFFLGALWAFSAWYSAAVEEPFVRWLRGRTDGWGNMMPKRSAENAPASGAAKEEEEVAGSENSRSAGWVSSLLPIWTTVVC